MSLILGVRRAQTELCRVPFGERIDRYRTSLAMISGVRTEQDLTRELLDKERAILSAALRAVEEPGKLFPVPGLSARPNHETVNEETGFEWKSRVRDERIEYLVRWAPVMAIEDAAERGLC